MKRITTLWLLASLLPVLQAGETRIWTSRKGSTVEAELLRQDGVNATLVTKEAKQIVLKLDDLSLADRQFLVEYGEADPKILVTGDLGSPEKEVRIDAATIKKLKDKTLVFGSETEAEFELLESQHFLVATAGDARPQGIAETAERVWHGMAFQHMNFRRDWGDKRMLIIIAEKPEAHEALGRWYKAFLTEKDQVEAARKMASTWSKSSGNSINLSEEIMKKFNLSSLAPVFKPTPEADMKKPMSPFLIHCLADNMIEKQMGGVSSFGAEGYFAVTTGHAYYKEIALGGKSETRIIAAEESSGDGSSEKGGFDEATSWARELKSLVRKGDVKVELEPLLKWKSTDLKPDRLALIYSLSYYMQSTAARLNSFAAMIRRIESSNQIPAPIEIAKLFGFESVEAFDADWALFIKEGKFK